MLYGPALGPGIPELAQPLAVCLGDSDCWRLESIPYLLDRKPPTVVPLHTADLPLRLSVLLEMDTEAECSAPAGCSGLPLLAADCCGLCGAAGSRAVDPRLAGLRAYYPSLESHADLGPLHGGHFAADNSADHAPSLGQKVAHLGAVGFPNPGAAWLHALSTKDWPAICGCAHCLQQPGYRPPAADPGCAGQLRLQFLPVALEPHER